MLMNKRRHTWETYNVRMDGVALYSDGGIVMQAPYEVGVILTGRQRVFRDFFVRVELATGDTITATDRYGLRAALLHLRDQLALAGIELHVAGLSPTFYETGLSSNSGFGYVAGLSSPVHMMDSVPPQG
jgi:hypothetical protein